VADRDQLDAEVEKVVEACAHAIRDQVRRDHNITPPRVVRELSYIVVVVVCVVCVSCVSCRVCRVSDIYSKQRGTSQSRA
jgi:hypothetical protein